jgi:hypothetical protein
LLSLIQPLAGIFRRGESVKMTPPLPSRKSWDDSNPDLQTQLEELLAAVWAAEEDWRLDDRIDLALKLRRRDQKAA